MVDCSLRQRQDVFGDEPMQPTGPAVRIPWAFGDHPFALGIAATFPGRNTMRLKTAIITLMCLALAVPAMAGSFEEVVRISSDELVIANLVGHIEVVQGGDEYVIEIRVQGADADRDEIKIVQETIDGVDVLRVEFPVDEHKTYIYPGMGRGKSSIQFRNTDETDSVWNKIRDAIGGQRITVKGKGSGFEAWADITVKVPRDCITTIRLGVGDIVAREVTGDLTLDTNSGPITAERINGSLVCDTGSGSVSVSRCSGYINVDTGSGSVTGDHLKGDKILIDTGSGGVQLENIDCEKLDVDTGSGSVKALGVGCDSARIDTGSGSVRLELVRMGGGRFLVDTGSGGVTLVLPDDASCSVSCDTGSGGVKVDIPNVSVERDGRNEARFTVGTGEASVILDTGSGAITVKTF